MAEKLASLKKKGGGFSETVLWTTSTPTTLSATTISLSDSLSNYKYIKIIYRIYNYDKISSENVAMTDIETFKRATNSALAPRLMLGAKNVNNSALYAREVRYNSDTSITFGDGTMVGGTTIASTVCVPNRVIGLK